MGGLKFLGRLFCYSSVCDFQKTAKLNRASHYTLIPELKSVFLSYMILNYLQMITEAQ
jgi:hypothetical protein